MLRVFSLLLSLIAFRVPHRTSRFFGIGGWMVRGSFLILIALLGYLPGAKASFELTDNVYLLGCPFMHEDAYDFSSLLGELKTQIQTKVDGKSSCGAALAPVYEQFSAYQTYLDRLDPSARGDRGGRACELPRWIERPTGPARNRRSRADARGGRVRFDHLEYSRGRKPDS